MHDRTYESELEAEIRRLRAENDELRATIGMVRFALGKVAENLEPVR